MGQIIGSAAKPKRCNKNRLSQLGTPAAGEYILVSSDNSMNAAGQGNFDCYIEGDGRTAATALGLKSLVDDGIFDISAYHATGDVLAKYADLSAALGANGANIPQSIRKGGISVKFVRSSDNNYVQFRYMETDATTAETFTNVANWQGVDETPTAGSQNLVTSGGVKAEIDAIDLEIGESVAIDASKFDRHRFIISPHYDGYIWYQRTKSCHCVIPLNNVTKIILKSSINSGFAFFTDDYTPPVSTSSALYFVPNTALTNTTANVNKEVSVPEGAAYLYLPIISGADADVNWNVTFINENSLSERINNEKSERQSDITFLKNRIIPKAEIVFPTQPLIIDNSAKTFNLPSLVYKKNGGNTVIIEPAITDLSFGTLSGSLSWACLVLDTNTNTFSIKEVINTDVVNTDIIICTFRVSFGTKVDNRYPYTILFVNYSAVDYELYNGTTLLSKNVKYTDIQSVATNINTVAVNVVNVSNELAASNDTTFKTIGLLNIDFSALTQNNGALSVPNWYHAYPALSKHVVIPCAKDDSFKIKPSSLTATSAYYAWLTSDYIPPTSDSAIPYVSGTSRIAINNNVETVVTAPETAAFLCLTTIDGGNNTIFWEISRYSQNGLIVKELAELDNRVTALEPSSGGEDIMFFDSNKLLNYSSSSLYRFIGQNMPGYRDGNAMQGCAIYGNYLFILRNTGVVDYYTIGNDKTTFTYIGQFSLGSTGSDNHCNSAQFDPKITEGDFPYLYVSACTSYNYKCFVELFSFENNVFSSTLKQTITLGNDIIATLPNDFAYHTCDIVQDDKYLYAIFQSVMYGDWLAVIKLNKPAVSDGDVTLSVSDIVLTWYDDVEKFVRQDSKVYGNHLYISHGGSYTDINYTRGIKVYNILNGQKEFDIDLVDFTHEEIEGVELKNNMLYIFTLSSNYFVIKDF